MSTINNNSIFFSSLDDVSLSPLKLSNLNSQVLTRPKSFPVLLQPKLQRPTLFSLLGSTQSCPRTSLIQELDFSYVSNTALKPYSERTSVVIDQTWARTTPTPTSYTNERLTDKDAWKTQLTPISRRNFVSPVYQLLDNTSSESSPVQNHSPAVISKECLHNTTNIIRKPTPERNNILSENKLHQQHLGTNQELIQTRQHSPSIKLIKQSRIHTNTSQSSSTMVECNKVIPEHDTIQEHTPAHQRSPFVISKEWSHNSNAVQGPTPMAECRYSGHGFNRLSHSPQVSSDRSSFDADQSWRQMSPTEGYAQLPPIMIPNRGLNQRASIIIPEHEVNQQSNMQSRILTQPCSQADSASTTLLTLNQRLKQEQANKENETESKEFACSECDKMYKGKNARSILRRHLKDKHKIEQPRGTRWDNDPNRPKTDEERRQRMLESKRRSALKARERKNNQRVMMQQINNSQSGSRRSDLYSVSKAELSLILSPPRTPRNLCSSPVHYKIQ
ncbi:hypothetical protein RclHR1_01440006 [Rhizophagus clarus]|uniref:Uncharacterized protein n=1 Tax=Rhizophagus clarus TaxID=94130 RepID=A0A2Z6QT36_9GLOM|nr:hypothetical protein RclHR1_01440006 [Rhizophagus clarus]GES78280.1 hypothetical protein GLOIN_2v1533667 [Rhizophagus clarus]